MCGVTAAKRFCFIELPYWRCICAMVIGYARVFTYDQETAAQVAALKAAGCDASIVRIAPAGGGTPARRSVLG